MKKSFHFLFILFYSINCCAQISNQDVINYLKGKVFKHEKYYKSGEIYPAQTLTFIGMEKDSDNPFEYNPYPNATDFAGKKWDFPENRFLFKVEAGDGFEPNFYCIYSIGLLENGAIVLIFRQYWKSQVKETKWESICNGCSQMKSVETVRDVINYGNNVLQFYLVTYRNSAPNSLKAALSYLPNLFINEATFVLKN